MDSLFPRRPRYAELGIQRQSATCEDRLAGDVRSLVGRQERKYVSDLARLGGAEAEDTVTVAFVSTVILLRHGKSTANGSGVLAGRTPKVGLDDTEPHLFSTGIETGNGLEPIAITRMSGYHLSNTDVDGYSYDISPDGLEIALTANVDKTVATLIDWQKATKDAVRGTQAPADWFNDEQTQQDAADQQNKVDGLTQAPAFRYETNIDNRALSIFRSDFPPMLGGKGPLKITIGDKSQDLPLAGVVEPLRKFSATCFGRS